MRFAACFTLCLFLANLDNRIAGGQETTIKKFPHQVCMRYKGVPGCNGAIITEKHVLTAARCVYKDELRYYQIVAGATNYLGDDWQQLR